MASSDFLARFGAVQQRIGTASADESRQLTITRRELKATFTQATAGDEGRQ